MAKRVSIDVEGYHHGGLPIPAASRVGPLVMTGGISGIDPETRALPDDLAEQARLMFFNLERIMVAAGGSMDCLRRAPAGGTVRWGRHPQPLRGAIGGLQDAQGRASGGQPAAQCERQDPEAQSARMGTGAARLRYPE